MNTLRQDIIEARREAYREAKATMPFVWSRGAYLATLDAQGNQCEPSPGADGYAWDGNLASIRTFIERVSREHPRVARIVVEGGYDGSETMADRKTNYEPWIASWTVSVWQR